ncbi:nitroreductase family protein [Leucobacter allii]|uniref:Putative NAD(P)H nitroreductase n=1 Tax=Leucobacter allii TaxID=2932247 RepID=A0ABY4FJZ8_9MICO|nr:nitroreductase family protein [Leucobacter allii]UOQ56432.1 nitroreductase family protein [Leucobacter allii]
MNPPIDDGGGGAAFQALRGRRSHSKVSDEAPSRAELERYLAAMSSISDHSGLRPWRIIELRGDARQRLGAGLAAAAGGDEAKFLAKATRAPLVLAIVISPRPSRKVPLWEQEAVGSGVAHVLELLLHEDGWGAMWRTGPHTRDPRVAAALGVEDPEYLLGWLYVGGIRERDRKQKPRAPLDVSQHLTAL